MTRLQRVVVLALFLGGCAQPAPDQEEAPSEVSPERQARELAQALILVDTHVDLPYRLQRNTEDISVETESGEFDFPRAREGGLDVPFMSIYVPASIPAGDEAHAFADGLIDMVEDWAGRWPEKFALARSVEEVRQNFRRGVISLPMGMENGTPIGSDRKNLQYFFDRGIRYITLTHSENNQICDSSYAAEKKWNGLSPFGNEVVREMNRLGMMIDVSHISDEAFFQVMELSSAPVIASHSSCRAFTPGWERNMSDEMIKQLAEKGGVIQINFGSMFLHDGYRRVSSQLWEELRAEGVAPESPRGRGLMEQFKQEHPLPEVSVADAVAHIRHVVELVGIDHVGLGSDFDGVGGHLPAGLSDVSEYPNLIRALLEEGYSEEEIGKICGENLLRVWSEVSGRAASQGN